MEVLCERCRTEYEFDDALVSERGTTVKCTQCGHRFRIFRPKNTSPGAEVWLVRTRSGADLTYTSIRQLQQAITGGNIERSDTLLRDGLPPRLLSAIPELDPFFQKARPESLSPPVSLRVPSSDKTTDLGLGLPPSSSDGPVSLQPKSDEYEEETVPRGKSLTGEESIEEFPNVLAAEVHAAKAAQGTTTAKSAVVAVSAPPRVTRERMTPTPADVRISYQDLQDYLPTDPRLQAPRDRRRSTLRWAVMAVVGCVGLAGAIGGVRWYMARATPGDMAEDGRTQTWLKEGDERLLQGDLDGAKASYDKASAVAESSPRVMRKLAQVAILRAEYVWLTLQLRDPAQTEAQELTRRELDVRSAEAKKLAKAALDAEPSDGNGRRLWVDALRLSGDMKGAREEVGRLAGDRDFELGVTLAALEMTETNPSWTTTIDRLRGAVTQEGKLQRARALLVLALVRSGDHEGAKTQLAIMMRTDVVHPKLVDLKLYVARITGETVDAGASPRVVQSDPTNAADRDPKGQGLLIDKAHSALRQGDLDTAERYFRAILDEKPTDSEALSGLGDVAKARGDKEGSAAYYAKVGQNNPDYLPALVGLANSKWDSGDREGAKALYSKILQATGGEGPYASQARSRLNEPTDPTPAPPPSSADSPAPSPEPAPSVVEQGSP